MKMLINHQSSCLTEEVNKETIDIRLCLEHFQLIEYNLNVKSKTTLQNARPHF